MDLDAAIRKVADFPKKGITFYDITSLFANPEAFRYVVDTMMDRYADTRVDGVIAVESRGFLLASCFAYKAGVPVILARKKGKLPGETYECSYDLEYGSATMEIHKADLALGKRWLIIDDLIATGGTLEAVARMTEQAGGEVVGIFSIIGLPFLSYNEKLQRYNPVTLIDYQGE